MPRYGITYNDVVQAAEELLHQQRNPTMENVREYLGGTGSFATLSKHLNTWRQNRLLASNQNNPLPVAPPDEVSKAVNHVWQQLNEKAQQEIAQLKEEQQAQLQALKVANDALTEENKQYQAHLQKLEIESSHLKADIELLRAELIEERKQKAILQEQYKGRVATLESIVEEKEKALSILIQQTEKRIEECEIKRNEEQQSLRAELDKMLAYQEEQRQRYIVKIDKLKVTHIQLEKTNAQLATEIKHSKARIEVLEEQLRGYAIDFKTLQHKYRQLLEEKNKTVVQVASLETELSQTRLRMDELTKQLSFVQQTLLQKLEAQAKKIPVKKKEKPKVKSAEFKSAKEH